MEKETGDKMNMTLEECVLNHLDQIKKTLDKSNCWKEIETLKKEINDSNKIQSQLTKLKKLENNPYDIEYRNLRNLLFQNPKIKKYKYYERELFYFNLELNQKLKEILPRKEEFKNENH